MYFELLMTAVDIFLKTLERLSLQVTVEQVLNVTDDVLFVNGVEYKLIDYDECVVAGLGKASLGMGKAVERLLGERFHRGVLVTDRLPGDPLKSKVVVSSHPVPSNESFRAGEMLIELLKSCGKRSLVIGLVSGGGSALVESPIASDVSLEDIRTVNRELVLCGATIREINCVRKQLSRIKGGGLARLVGASTLIVLYISDVNAGDLASIASGPFLPDDSSKAEALSVLEKFHLLDRVPPSVRGLLSGRGPLTQHSSDTESVRGQHVLVQDNDLALRVAGGVAQARGFNVELDHEGGESFYRDEAERLIARFILLRERFPDEQVCLISGGEVACPARGNGAGGRNQEFVIYSATRLAQLSFEGPTAVLSAGTDGLDGNSGAAGAVAGGRAAEGAAARGLDPLSFVKQNNSHSFLKALGGLMITGPSGNNVRDVRLFLAGKPPQLHQSEPCLEEKG